MRIATTLFIATALLAGVLAPAPRSFGMLSSAAVVGDAHDPPQMVARANVSDEDGARLTIRVVDRRGAPLPSAGVAIGDKSLACDSQGVVVVPGLRIGALAQFRAGAKAHVGRFQQVRIEALENEVVVTLEEEAVLEGIVVGVEGGPPTEKTRVQAHRRHVEVHGSIDDEGRFRISDLEAGTWEVEAFIVARPWVLARQEVVVPGPTVTLRLDAVAHRGVGLHGIVTDEATGVRLPSFTVTPHRPGEVRSLQFHGGEYEVAGIPAVQTTLVEFRADGYASLQVPVRLAAGDHPLDVALRRRIHVEFRIVDATGKPMHLARLLAFAENGAPIPLRESVALTDVFLDADLTGVIRAAGLPQGPCIVEVAPWPGGPSRRQAFDFTNAPAVPIDLVVDAVPWHVRELSFDLPESDAALVIFHVEVLGTEVLSRCRVIARRTGFRIDRPGHTAVVGAPTVRFELPSIPLQARVHWAGSDRTSVDLPPPSGAFARTTIARE